MSSRRGSDADVEDNATCLECHGKEDATGAIDGEEVSLHVSQTSFDASAHSDLSCVDCHEDIEELPHEDELERVDCATCHAE